MRGRRGSGRSGNGPSHFIVLRIDNAELLAKAKEVQDKITERYPELRRWTTSLGRAHIVLVALHLGGDQATVDAAVAAVRSAREVMARSFPERGPKLHFKGVATFDSGRVLHCPADPEDSHADIAALTAMVRDLREFLASRLPADAFDAPREFSAHLALAKARRFQFLFRQRRQAARAGADPEIMFPREVYEAFESTYIGEQNFTKIELVSLISPLPADASYRTIAHAEFNGCPVTPDDEEPEIIAAPAPAPAPAQVTHTQFQRRRRAPASAPAPVAAAAASAPITMSEADARELREWRLFGQALKAFLIESMPRIGAQQQQQTQQGPGPNFEKNKMKRLRRREAKMRMIIKAREARARSLAQAPAPAAPAPPQP
jgi:hypothetical protein